MLFARHPLHLRREARGRIVRHTSLRRAVVVVAVGAALGAGTTPVHATLIPFGTVLIAGSQWAGADAWLGNLNVYSNGSQLHDQAGTFGLEYECTELAQRWAHYKFGEPATWPISNAADMWRVGPTLPVPLFQNPNGGARPPRYGDLMVFAATSTNPTGHVSIVSSVTATTVTSVQQNFSVNGTLTGQWTQSMSGTTVSSLGGLPVLGWLRPGTPPPPAPSRPMDASSTPSAAVTPDGSSQVVFWKGADSHLTEAWYSGGRWHGPVDFSSFGTLLSSPSVAITKDGSAQTVFWQGSNYHLYEAWYTSAWNGPIDLTAWSGVAAASSAPSAVTTSDGTQAVFWRGLDNRLWEAWFAGGRWHGSVDHSSFGTLLSAPSVTVTPDGGAQLVLWKGADSHLTEAWYAGGSWHGPVDFTTFGTLLSSPSVSTTANGSQTVYWQGSNDHLYEAWYTGSWNGPVDWTAWRGVGPLSSAPSASVTTDGSTQIVFWAGPGEFLNEAWWAAGWNGPVAVTAA